MAYLIFPFLYLTNKNQYQWTVSNFGSTPFYKGSNLLGYFALSPGNFYQ